MRKRNTNKIQSQPPFMQKLQAVERLQQQADTTVFEWVKLLVEVAEDEDYHERLRGLTKNGIVSTDVVCQSLDSYTVARTGFHFERLWAIYREFPDAIPWAKNGIVGLDALLGSLQSARESNEQPKRRRRGVTLKEYEELQSENNRLVSVAKETQSKFNEAVAANTRLSDSHEQLKMLYQAAKQRIAELEKENGELKALLARPVELVA